MNFRFAKLLALLFAGALSITACSMIGSVTDAINPFNDGDDNKDQGEIPDDPERISILSLDEELKVAGTMLTSEIILPEVYTNTDWAQTGDMPIMRRNAPMRPAISTASGVVMSARARTGKAVSSLRRLLPVAGFLPSTGITGSAQPTPLPAAKSGRTRSGLPSGKDAPRWAQLC